MHKHWLFLVVDAIQLAKYNEQKKKKTFGYTSNVLECVFVSSLLDATLRLAHNKTLCVYFVVLYEMEMIWSLDMP